MKRPYLDRDIRPLSDFRANAAECIQQVQGSKRPLIITYNGKSAAVLLDVSAFEALVQRLELLEDIHTGESQIDSGEGLPHRRARDAVRKRISTR
jgi:prevent-host-death family protein